jgi:hypothetical protein
MYICSECGQGYDRGGYCAADGSPLAASDDALLGAQIGSYRLARLIGTGGMGRVYLAVHPVIGSRVAIKVLADSCARDPELLERFFAEARAVKTSPRSIQTAAGRSARLPLRRPVVLRQRVRRPRHREVLSRRLPLTRIRAAVRPIPLL